MTAFITKAISLFTLGAALTLSSVTQATPITYKFSASNFQSIVNPGGSTGPHQTLSGTFTLDGANLTDLDFILGNTEFTTSNSKYANGVLGGNACSPICLTGFTNDFLLVLDQLTLNFSALYYSDVRFNDIWLSTTGTVAVSKAPEPGPLMLMLCGLLALGLRARKFSR